MFEFRDWHSNQASFSLPHQPNGHVELYRGELYNFLTRNEVVLSLVLNLIKRRCLSLQRIMTALVNLSICNKTPFTRGVAMWTLTTVRLIDARTC